MEYMEGFTYDAESTDLTSGECKAYAEIVHYLCHLELQHRVSLLLANTYGVAGTSAQDRAQLKARQMWRTEVRT